MARLRGPLTALLLAGASVPPLFAAGLAPELAPIEIRAIRFEPNDWQRLLHYFKETGPNAPRYTPSDGFIPATFGFEAITGVEGKPHRAEYFNLWGYETDGHFAPYEVKFVSEDWKAFKPEYTHDARAKESCAKRACLFVDQWILSLDLQGNKTGAYHGSVIEDETRTVYGSDTFQASDAETKAKIETLRTLWSKVLDSRFPAKP